MYTTIDENKKLQVYAEEVDICYSCSHMNTCPLIAALQSEVAILKYEAVEVQDCGVFEHYSINNLIEDLRC